MFYDHIHDNMNAMFFNEAKMKKTQTWVLEKLGTNETVGLVFSLPFMSELQLRKMSNPKKYMKSKNEKNAFYVTVTQF